MNKTFNRNKFNINNNSNKSNSNNQVINQKILMKFY